MSDRTRLQHVKRVEKKIRKFKKASRSTAGLEKELSFAKKETPVPSFKTGRVAHALGEQKRARKTLAPASK